jgi:similar to spore coat protein
MNQETLAPHETLELHEILRIKQTELKKLKTSMTMVQNQKLLSFMQDCIASSKAFISELQEISNKPNTEIGGH